MMIRSLCELVLPRRPRQGDLSHPFARPPIPSRRRLCLESLEDRLMLHHGTLLPAGFTEVEIANGLEPTAMEIAFDDRIFIAGTRSHSRR